MERVVNSFKYEATWLRFDVAKDLLDSFIERSPETFCTFPFTYVNFGHDGRVDPCCTSAFGRPGNHHTDPWNDSLFRSIRRDLLNGKKLSGCDSCWRLERQNIVSPRKEEFGENKFREQFNELVRYDFKTGALQNGPTRIKICLSNLCNLQCRMCNPEFSSRWEHSYAKSPQMRQWMKERGFETDSYLRPPKPDIDYVDFIIAFIERHAPTLRQLEILGGEPLIQPEHLRALDAVKGYEKEITLNYSSNFNLISAATDSLIERWNRFLSIEINMSIDGVGALNDYIRWGADYPRMFKNLETIRERLKGGPRLEVYSYTTFSAYNAPQAIDIVKEVTRRGLFMISGVVQSPPFLSPQVLPVQLRQRIADDLSNFIERATEELAADFDVHSFWNDENNRRDQIKRVRRRLNDFKMYLLGEDHSRMFPTFIEFDRVFNEAVQSKSSVFDFYPEWKDLK